MRNFEWCIYTYKHRIAFRYVAEKLIKDKELLDKILIRAKVHDMDKLLLYQFFDWEECIDYHVKHQAHHLESGLMNSYEDYVEMVIDYECAPYTKPDKPLNAFDFVNRLLEWNYLEKDTAEILFQIMHDLGIDYSYDITSNPENMNFVNRIGEVSEEMILLEIVEYVSTNPKQVLDYVRGRQ